MADGLLMLEAAMITFSKEKNSRAIDMVEFHRWCEIHCPQAAVELEKFAAKVFNRGMSSDA